MALDFSKYDKQVDLGAFKNNVEEAEKNGGFSEYPEVPKGVYVVKIEKLEIGETKDGRPMLKVQARIVDGEFKKQCIFMNRVLFGTKNDAGMIASAVSFLKKLEPSDEVGEVVFDSFSQFNDLVLDIAEDIDGLEYEIDYDPKGFNTIGIRDVFEA